MKDTLGIIVKEGDVILRAKFGNLVTHKVLKINDKSLVLSVERKTYGYNNRNSYITDTPNLNLHNSNIRISKHLLFNAIIKIN